VVEQLAGSRFCKLRVVDVMVQFQHFHPPCVFADGVEKGGAGLSIFEGLPRASIAETPRRGNRIVVGPFEAAALRPISAPKAAFSSGVVRIRVTVGLWQ
jgi:hypothetical protein